MDLILFDTAHGPMGLAEEDGALVRLYLPGEGVPRLPPRETPLLAEGRRQITAYLAGARRSFNLPLSPGGTEFRRRVWRALTEIPYGVTISYGELATAIGSVKAVRAVGQANHHNPLPILIPCHRVVGADGTLTGYGGGLALKECLLTLEGVHIRNGRLERSELP